MNRKILLLTVAGALAVAILPSFLPTGPSTDYDAVKFFTGGQTLAGVLIILGTGLLTALTPCVYPLIPITVSVFGASRADSRLKAVLLTCSYVIGMGVVFSALGATAALTGSLFGAALSNPWVVCGLALFMVLLASSMFGAFELALPQGLTQRLNMVGGAGIVGAFLMGSVSGFLAAPCTGPMLTGLLTFIAKSQSVPLGAALMFVYALGVGLPFFVIGVFTVRLPKSGVWMEWVKSILGIILLGMAAGYLRDGFPALTRFSHDVGVQLGRVPGAAFAAVLTAVGVLLGAVHLSFKEDSAQRVRKAVGVGVVVVAILLRISALGAPHTGDLWVKAGWAEPPKKTFNWQLSFPNESVTDVSAFNALLDKAKAEGRPVMIDFFAEWCAACKELDRHTYVAPPVIDESTRFVTIKVDATSNPPFLDDLYDRFGVEGLPTVAFVDSHGTIMEKPKITGFLEPELFIKEMQKVR
ncbi:MAG: thioredoxin family protein [Myxococcaceae bacterium]|nr:thioredoxin family protein [Myxococcaceae bacterium]